MARKGPKPLMVVESETLGEPIVEEFLGSDNELEKEVLKVAPAVAPLVKAFSAAIQRAQAIAAGIKDAETFQAADDARAEWKQQGVAIHKGFEYAAKKAYESHRAITALRDKLAAIPMTAAGIVEKGQIQWRTKEQQKQLEAAKVAAENAKKAAAEQALAQADVLLAEDRTEEAEQVLEDAKPEPAPPPTFSVPKVKGSNRGYWKWIFDTAPRGEDTLVKAIVAPIRLAADLLRKEGAGGKALADLEAAAHLVEFYMCPDERRIGGFVKTNEKAAVGKIPGVHVWFEERIV